MVFVFTETDWMYDLYFGIVFERNWHRNVKVKNAIFGDGNIENNFDKAFGK